MQMYPHEASCYAFSQASGHGDARLSLSSSSHGCRRIPLFLLFLACFSSPFQQRLPSFFDLPPSRSAFLTNIRLFRLHIGAPTSSSAFHTRSLSRFDPTIRLIASDDGNIPTLSRLFTPVAEMFEFDEKLYRSVLNSKPKQAPLRPVAGRR